MSETKDTDIIVLLTEIKTKQETMASDIADIKTQFRERDKTCQDHTTKIAVLESKVSNGEKKKELIDAVA